jgi:hypothetical protein
MVRFTPALILVLLGATACSGGEAACEAAAETIATCFPNQAVATCDPETAEQIAASSCDELTASGKADDPITCFWMPWLCSGGSTTSGGTIEVAVEECGGMRGDLCPYVTSASCALVTLHDASNAEVARGYTSAGGRFTVNGLADGNFTVKIHERDGSLATMQPYELSSNEEPAKVRVDVARGEDAPWARFALVPDSQERITQCADLAGGLTVKSPSGAEVDRHEVEWDWIVELEREGQVVERTRPLFIHHEATESGQDENVLGFRTLVMGEYTVRLVRVDIPESRQRPNPDYAQLVRLYAVDAVAPIETTVKVTSAKRGKILSISQTIVDPIAE